MGPLALTTIFPKGTSHAEKSIYYLGAAWSWLPILASCIKIRDIYSCRGAEVCFNEHNAFPESGLRCRTQRRAALAIQGSLDACNP
jgi:hypothetical protein